MAPPKGTKPTRPFPKGNPGRPVGSKNKVPQSVRDSFLTAFQQRGGATALIDFAAKSDENERAFYQLASKLIPSEIVASVNVAILTDDERRARLADLLGLK